MLKKTVLVFNGPGAVGKSLLMQQLMTSCAIGAEFLGQRMPKVSSFGWFAEDPRDEMRRRQADINHYYDIDPADTDGMSLTAADEMDDPTLYHAATRTSVGRPSQAWLSLRGHVLGEGCQLAVLDNAALIFDGNANYPELVAPFMQEAKKLASDMADGTGGVVVIIQHPSQEGETTGSGQAGARAWSNLARARWYMTFPKEFDEDGDEVCYERVVRTKKNNYGPRKGPMRVEWRAGVFVPVAVSGQSGGRLPLDKFIELRGRIEWTIRDMVKRGERVSNANGARDHFWAIVGKHPAWKMYHHNDVQPALDALLKDGRLLIVDLGTGTRARRLIRTPDTTYPGEEVVKT